MTTGSPNPLVFDSKPKNSTSNHHNEQLVNLFPSTKCALPGSSVWLMVKLLRANLKARIHDILFTSFSSSLSSQINLNGFQAKLENGCIKKNENNSTNENVSSISAGRFNGSLDKPIGDNLLGVAASVISESVAGWIKEMMSKKTNIELISTEELEMHITRHMKTKDVLVDASGTLARNIAEISLSIEKSIEYIKALYKDPSRRPNVVHTDFPLPPELTYVLTGDEDLLKRKIDDHRRGNKETNTLMDPTPEIRSHDLFVPNKNIHETFINQVSVSAGGVRSNSLNPGDLIGRGNKSQNFGENTGIVLDLESSDLDKPKNILRKRERTDYELWEIQKFASSGVLRRDDVEFKEVYNSIGQGNSLVSVHKNQIDLRLKNDEPSFLKGLTVYSRNTNRNMVSTSTRSTDSAVQLVREPDGTLQRAALQSKEQILQRRISRKESGVRTDQSRKTGSDYRSRDTKPPSRHNDTISKSPWGGDGANANEKPKNWSTLPIHNYKNVIIETLELNQILIVVGETGSGKTTQMTQFLVDSGYSSKGMIACTQPRRVAAITVAKRVAEEMGCRLGGEVGYHIRFTDLTSSRTKIKYMTDGMLLREVLTDKMLSKYSVLILDEAHERTVNTDVLFGLCKNAVVERNKLKTDTHFSVTPLKLIVTSATLDADRFSGYFLNAPIITIPGRAFPVDIMYSTEPVEDYFEASISTVLEIHLTQPKGDILLFLTGQEEIDLAVESINQRMKVIENSVDELEDADDLRPPPLLCMGVYASLPCEAQSHIFESAPDGCRKCVVATNIAEASITIDGIVYVVDPGMCKVKVFCPKAQMDQLVVAPISRANASQRSGRAGRTGPGFCYRLYTENAFNNEMLPSPVPEIQRSNLSNVILLLKALGVQDPLHFDFMDPPPFPAVVASLHSLWQLEALDEGGNLTSLGKRLADLPMTPEESKFLLCSVDLGCSQEAVIICSMVQEQSVFYTPRDRVEEAERRKQQFFSPEGDHCTFLEVYREWEKNNYNVSWCYENYIQHRTLKRARDMVKQLTQHLSRLNYELVSCGKNYNKVSQALCAGYFNNLCRRDPTDGYRVLRDAQQVHIHPSSVLCQQRPQWVIYQELVMTTKEYIRGVTSVESSWVASLAPRMFEKVREGAGEMSMLKMHEKIEPLYSAIHDRESLRILAKRKC